jgi:hypothetical protein
LQSLQRQRIDVGDDLRVSAGYVGKSRRRSDLRGLPIRVPVKASVDRAGWTARTGRFSGRERAGISSVGTPNAAKPFTAILEFMADMPGRIVVVPKTGAKALIEVNIAR